MKVSIGSKIVQGPWGGGNLFAINLSNYLLSQGHSVIYDLTDPDIDLILLTDPRSRGESSSTFNHIDIEQYRKYINPRVAVIQRINECDERKNTNNINSFYMNASNVADHVVFVSTWLRNIYLQLGMSPKKSSVILAGANSEVFNPTNAQTYTKDSKVKLVTHHWSSHSNKGFDIYKKIDDLLSNSEWSNKVEFTYIGNLPSNFNFKHTKVIEPLAGVDLANEIKKNHIYITASINEPSGNHHIEAAQCGLPILYKESGGIPEYCKNFGISFSDDFEIKLDEIIRNYNILKTKMPHYPFNSAKMCKDFLELFETELEKTKYLDDVSPNSWFLKYLFIYKNKILKFLRRIFAFSIKNKLTTLARYILKK